MTQQPHYRVWCLSWDDRKEDGTDIVTSHNYATAKRGVVYVPCLVSSAADAARAYAEYVVFRQRDGWEATWPLEFRVRSPDGSTADFEVTCEHVPEFNAFPVKKRIQQKAARS